MTFFTKETVQLFSFTYVEYPQPNTPKSMESGRFRY